MPAEEEKWLVWGVEEILRIVQDSQTKSDVGVSEKINGSSDESRMVLAELELPGWVTTTDLGAPLEALGAFYARSGNLE